MHDVLGEVRAASRDRRRNDADAARAQRRFAAAENFGLDLVEERELAGLHQPVLAQAKAEQHRLLDPLVDRPLADALALGDADLAGVEAGDHLIDGSRGSRGLLPGESERGLPRRGRSCFAADGSWKKVAEVEDDVGRGRVAPRAATDRIVGSGSRRETVAAVGRARHFCPHHEGVADSAAAGSATAGAGVQPFLRCSATTLV